MSMTDSSASAAPARSSQVNLAVGLAAATVVAFVILAATDADGPIWLLLPVLGAVTAFVGWRSGGGSRPSGLALGAVVVGVAAIVTVLVWVLADSM